MTPFRRLAESPAAPRQAIVRRHHRALVTWLSVILGYLALGWLFFHPVSVLAQGANLDVNQIIGASGSNDESRKLWRMLLGSFADNPFAALGTPSSLIGGMFLVLNTCFFVVGVTYFTYGIVKGAIATAQEGEVLGKRQSVVWFPIRGLIGVAGSMPIFGGFNMMQAVLVYIMLIGIGTANMVMVKALDMTNSFQGLLQPSAFAPLGVTQGAKDMARQMFLSKVCMIAQNDLAASIGATGVVVEPVQQFAQSGASTGTIIWGTGSAPHACGSVSVSLSTRSESSITGFRVASVNYPAYANAAYGAWTSALAQMDGQITPLAQSWYLARKNALEQDSGTAPAIDLKVIDAVALNAIQTATAAGAAQLQAAGGTGAITSTAMDNMKSLGWIGIGAWYSTFAEANAALADAASSVQMGRGNLVSDSPALNSSTVEAVNAAASKISEGLAIAGQTQTTTKTLMDSAIQDAGCGGALGNSVAGTATGNCSLGQGFVSAFVRGTTIGSGGGGNGEGAVGLDSSGLVNPIIAMKNAGDYILVLAQGLLAVGPVLEFADKFGLAKVAGTVVGGAAGTGGGPGGMIAGAAVGNLVGGAVAVLKVLAFTLLVAGAAMSVYIPLIPFITWIGAVLAYAASMFEGLAGMSLHAVSHLESEGEGLGQRTGHGYLFWINALARPALMVIGFFAASAMMIAIGTLQAHMFLPAMANVQGNSITGLASIILFILVFFVMNTTLISGAMNLIYVLTDQVIGFLGGVFNSHLGREVESKVNAAFLLGARVGPQAIGQVGQAIAGSKARAALPAPQRGQAGGGTAAGQSTGSRRS